MNILAIDTSNETMGVAVIKDGQVSGEYITNVKKNHSVRLLPAIDQVMRDTDVAPNELDQVVVAKGPGSYTGVRIGLSTAKTLAWTLNIPVIAISSLELVAQQAAYYNHQICSFFDARRGLVYTGLYENKESAALSTVWDETNILFVEWLEQLVQRGKKTVFLSPHIDIHRDVILQYMGDLAIIPESIYHVPRPSLLAQIAIDRQADPVHTLTPNYLRLVEAEAKWLENQGKKNNV
ncbi:tRNA (adenosine(37)-N6)-threonylcarbamoyltransferase complex dimerization subunit type 1 TsaB [Aquibacillus koreensis]|uniref:tRNA (Adenosine(37)-N6)-threonylcarbamoyltransferase complex dimerization subunit type 1 TsaB n=1 Tax=Aquibacillus koreensis TaxID=279446 RepID=A0A9X3WKU3_9BACI|nr:tRNA (adenosine(37)-N6)-threonylcarbamoyltransferase complex dimerization subunit type 1 TsaB [Aquibacillus koreensis]MCT2536694.1 tRNA (adenosine(37)-N6)-threonylcarbamoyltransferase complex dimerization subunit type 1 TsaB [Aquibacillus koreensis]MDC3421550.1 tRNA (adenosine(37)-N6)-threonylcarbamoyltransferase complex dimerization subunit type 1 TsaB [Aquibacillus koreensis]